MTLIDQQQQRLDLCINSAYRYIFKRPKTEQEVKIHLRSKGHDDETIDKVMVMLQRKWYVNDAQYVQMYIESELINKGRPSVIVMQKLLQRGVEKSVIKEHMAKHEDDISWWLHKRIAKEIDSYKKKWIDGFDIIQKLMRKGFRLKDIKIVINNRKQAEEMRE